MSNDNPKETNDELTAALRKALVEIGALIPTSPEEVELAEKHLTDGTTAEQVEASFRKLEEILDDDLVTSPFMQLHESVALPAEGCVSVAARHGPPNLGRETLAKIVDDVAGTEGTGKVIKPKLADAREAEILDLCEDIAREDSVSGPVSPARICATKEIKIVHDRYGAGSFDGMLVYYDSNWAIVCNCDAGNTPGSARERFTLAHELGHFHIPEHRRRLLAGGQPHRSHTGVFDRAESIEELEADTFAANLLMPPARFVNRLQALRQLPLQSITSLRKEFDTSLESTTIQTMRHDSRVVAIAKWEDKGLAWHRISESFFCETGYRQFRLRHSDSLPSDCATAAALADSELQFDSPIREVILTAAFCFGYVGAGGKRDILLREQAVRNGRFGVISVYSVFNERDSKASTGLGRAH